MSKTFPSWQIATMGIRKWMPNIVTPRGDENIDLGSGVELPGHSPALIKEINRWCDEQYGINGIDAKMFFHGYDQPYRQEFRFDRKARWASLNQNFFFKRPDNAFEFKIRWG